MFNVTGAQSEARDSWVAAALQILRQLGFTAVRLLTNNPEKMSGLEQCGIRVAERVPHIFPSNQHNTRYLVTKARRFGHMF